MSSSPACLQNEILSQKQTKKQANKPMNQQVKGFADKSCDLSFIPRNHNGKPELRLSVL